MDHHISDVVKRHIEEPGRNVRILPPLGRPWQARATGKANASWYLYRIQDADQNLCSVLLDVFDMTFLESEQMNVSKRNQGHGPIMILFHNAWAAAVVDVESYKPKRR